MDTNNKYKVLLIEDDRTFIDLLRNKCIDSGFGIEVAENGNQGLKLALETHPDVVVTDLTMPIMDGFEFLKELRKDSWGKKVPVIILSNYGDFDRISKALDIGAFYYLVKSDVEPKDVLSYIEKAIKESLV
jgi:DNA-binding response OmpR family regulator